MSKPLRCAIYIRVSTEEQHLNGLSLPAQQKALTEYAEDNHYTIVGNYADEGISARKSMKYRKGLLTLLEDVKKNKIDMILVTKLDRWFRNIKDYNITEEILTAHNCHWKTIYENYDSSTANGQMVINIMLSVNQAECDRTSERIRAVLDYKRSIGEVTSGRCACYGYKVENNRLVKDPDTAPIVEDIREYYFSCYSIRKTISYIQNKYKDAAPSANQIDRIFKNETYAGKDKDNLNYCEPYLTLEQFQKAREITKTKIYTSTYEPYLFSSLIKCPVCGSNYTGYRKKQKRKNGGESIYIKYRCGNKFNRHGGANLTEYKVETYMLAQVMPRLEQEAASVKLAPKNTSSKIDVPSLENELGRLNLQFQKGRIAERYYDEQYELLSNKIREAKQADKHASPETHNDLLQTFSGSWMTLYDSLDKAHKNSFWKSILSNIQVDADTHKIAGFNFIGKLV